jgi:hypothetical protein
MTTNSVDSPADPARERSPIGRLLDLARYLILVYAAFWAVMLIPLGYQSLFSQDTYGYDFCGARTCVLEHGIVGPDGVSSTAEYAEAEGLPATLCNTRIDFEYRNTDDRVYRTLPGPEVDGCSARVGRSVAAQRWEAGRACAVLYSNGHVIARQCHHVFPKL